FESHDRIGWIVIRDAVAVVLQAGLLPLEERQLAFAGCKETFLALRSVGEGGSLAFNLLLDNSKIISSHDDFCEECLEQNFLCPRSTVTATPFTPSPTENHVYPASHQRLFSCGSCHQCQRRWFSLNEQHLRH